MGNQKVHWLKNPNTYIIAVVVVVLAYLIIPRTEAGEVDSFAQCLTDEGAVMYGTNWCSFCKQQKALFGGSFKHVNYVDCDANRDECTAAGVTGYPTWSVAGELRSGVQSLEVLSSLTGCEIKN